MGGKAHVIAIPYPAQGHLIPMMKVAQVLAQNEIKVTIVITEFIHSQMVEEKMMNDELISLTPIPDGLEPWEDRSDVGKLLEAMSKTMPEKVEALIEKMNNERDDKVACIIVDYSLKLPLELVEKLKIKRSAFMTAAAAWVAFARNASKLIHQGFIDTNGTPLKQDEMIQLSPNMPPISTKNLLWTCIGDFNTQKQLFHSTTHNANSEELDWIICNSCDELEPAALKLAPKCLPIGPLLGQPSGNFWSQDLSSLSWLDQQPPNSTIYVAFGSSTFLDENQFHELALGLELTNRPFLWVVRQDLTHNIDNAYPKGFRERIESRGKIVSWAPQQKVLAHPSVACFLSHCGWNSTVEGVSSGVPFLCWPYFADQLLNHSYIVNCWEVGLGFEKDGQSGIFGKEEIKNKVDKIITDQSYKRRAFQLQSKILATVGEGGSSLNNFNNFIDFIKDN